MASKISAQQLTWRRWNAVERTCSGYMRYRHSHACDYLRPPKSVSPIQSDNFRNLKIEEKKNLKQWLKWFPIVLNSCLFLPSYYEGVQTAQISHLTSTQIKCDKYSQWFRAPSKGLLPYSRSFVLSCYFFCFIADCKVGKKKKGPCSRASRTAMIWSYCSTNVLG